MLYNRKWWTSVILVPNLWNSVSLYIIRLFEVESSSKSWVKWSAFCAGAVAAESRTSQKHIRTSEVKNFWSLALMKWFCVVTKSRPKSVFSILFDFHFFTFFSTIHPHLSTFPSSNSFISVTISAYCHCTTSFHASLHLNPGFSSFFFLVFPFLYLNRLSVSSAFCLLRFSAHIPSYIAVLGLSVACPWLSMPIFVYLRRPPSCLIWLRKGRLPHRMCIFLMQDVWIKKRLERSKSIKRHPSDP